MGKGKDPAGATAPGPETKFDTEGVLGLPKQSDMVKLLPPGAPLSAFSKFIGLRREEDTRTIALLSIYYTLSVIAWNLHPRFNWTVMMALYVTISAFSFIGACAVHNTMHCRMFHGKTANKVMQFALSLSYGHPVSSYVPGHNQSHHKYTQHPEDVMRTTKLRYKWHLLNGLFFQQHVAYAVMKNDFRYIATQSVMSQTWFNQALREFWVVGAVTVSLFVMDWRKALIYYYVPHMFAQWGIVSINIIQHDGCDVVTRGSATSGHLVESINIARNLTSPMLNYFTMNNGYHTIHHFYPTMHWSNYTTAHNLFVKSKLDPRLDVEVFSAYAFGTFVYPGVRQRFDGTAIKELQSDEPGDIDWIKYPDAMPKDKVERMLEPAALAKAVAIGCVLVPFKMICPIWSPLGTLI